MSVGSCQLLSFFATIEVGDDVHERGLRGQISSDWAEDRLLSQAAGYDAGAAGGEAVELSPAFIGHVEAPNVNKAVSLDTLFDVAAALDVPPYKFLTFDE